MIQNGYIQIENICIPIGILAVGFEHSQHKTFGWMTFEKYLGWWNELRRSDCFKIFAVSLIWRRPKCLIRITFGLRVSLEVAPSLSSSHLLWYSADGFKFQSRIILIWLTKLHFLCNLLWNGDLFNIWLEDVHFFRKKLKLCWHRFNLWFQLSRTVYFASNLLLSLCVAWNVFI